MTGTEFRAALADLGLTQPAAATLLGLSLRTVEYYAAGKPIPGPVKILVKLLQFGSLTPVDIDAVRGV
jgi:transcriptional regulator with XRE-family HTH domain